MRPQRLDGVRPTALEGLQQRREASESLKEIDKLLRDDHDHVSAPEPAKTAARCSFGSGRNRPKNPCYWVNTASSVPGPGAYAVAKADGIVKPSAGGGGALGLRSSVCCRFQPCECKNTREEPEEATADSFDGTRQDTKQPRRSSPPLVAYSRPADTETNFETREQQRRVAAVRAAKQRWTRVGVNTKPNYRWTERRVGAGGALPMGKSTSRDGAGHSAAKAKLRKLFIATRKTQKLLSHLFLAQTSFASAALYDAPILTSYGDIQGYPAFDSEPTGNVANWASITSWKNVPYAADTSGSNRWRPPQKPSAWTGTRDAEEYGPMCPSVRSDTGNYTVSEDCLNLNIWSPANSTDAKLPVMLWSTPAMSTARDPLFDGGGMAGQGIVYVNYNRRDGIFGYLAHPELGEEMLTDVGVNASGTWGVLDQFAALQWVYDNIEAFGGDPAQITVAGQSAGSAATYHMVNGPLVKGLVKHAIIESGLRYPYDPLCSTLAENYITLEVAEAAGESALESYNVSTVDELRDVDMDTLAAEISSWHVVLDGYALPTTYMESLINGPANDVPIITGNTKDESGAATDTNLTVAEYKAALVSQYGEEYADKFFELYSANDTATASAAYNAHYTDTSRISSWLFANTWQQYEKSPFWTYYWDHAPPGQTQGAYHESEINYVLNNLYLTDLPWEDEDYEIAAKMNGYWANFVKTGNPNDGDSYTGNDTLVNWPESTAESNVTHHVGDGWGEVLIASTPEQIELFEEFFATQTPF